MDETTPRASNSMINAKFVITDHMTQTEAFEVFTIYKFHIRNFRNRFRLCAIIAFSQIPDISFLFRNVLFGVPTSWNCW